MRILKESNRIFPILGCVIQFCVYQSFSLHNYVYQQVAIETPKECKNCGVVGWAAGEDRFILYQIFIDMKFSAFHLLSLVTLTHTYRQVMIRPWSYTIK